MKMSEKQACLLTAKLWQEIYDLVVCPQYLSKREINDINALKSNALKNINIDPNIKNHCPCCEFTITYNGIVDCEKCPMKGMWVFGNNGIVDCENKYSPYLDFLKSEGRYDTETNTCYSPLDAKEIIYRALEMAEWWQDLQDMNKM